jgi:hypothetical protein
MVPIRDLSRLVQIWHVLILVPIRELLMLVQNWQMLIWLEYGQTPLENKGRAQKPEQHLIKLMYLHWT